MIIQSSQVHLGQVNRFDSHISDKQTMRLGMEIQAKQTQNDATGMRSELALAVQERFDYVHKSRSAFQAESSVSQVNGESSQFHRQKMTSQVVALSLVGTEATVASMRAFPASDTASMEVTGKLEFEFQRKIEVETHSHTAMTASGKVTLQDGREIDFSLFTSHGANTKVSAETKVSLGLAVMQDPLVINFGTDKVQLSDQYIEFDLSGDGDNENIASLGAGSGYLMLDLDGNGKVSNGKELFGTESGNGFVDLAKYDADGNGWIDEADPIFNQLKLWSGGEDSEDLVMLSERGVGAIYLGQVAQAEDIRSSQGEQLGHVKAAGVVLMENGEVKTVQALDLAERIKSTELEKQDGGIENLDELQAMTEAVNEANAPFAALNEGGFQMGAFHNAFASINLWSNKEPFKQSDDDEWSLEKLFQQMNEAIQKAIERRKAMMEKLEEVSSEVRQRLSVVV